MQRALKRRGYDPGPIDGLMGRRTTTAIRKFQADHGLAVTGIARPSRLFRKSGLKPGDRLLLEMSSPDFDSYLVVGDKSGGIFNPIMEDDDSGADLGSRIRFIAPRTGTYWVLAQGYADYHYVVRQAAGGAKR